MVTVAVMVMMMMMMMIMVVMVRVMDKEKRRSDEPENPPLGMENLVECHGSCRLDRNKRNFNSAADDSMFKKAKRNSDEKHQHNSSKGHNNSRKQHN
jgi:hypothetical protein